MMNEINFLYRRYDYPYFCRKSFEQVLNNNVSHCISSLLNVILQWRVNVKTVVSTSLTMEEASSLTMYWQSVLHQQAIEKTIESRISTSTIPVLFLGFLSSVLCIRVDKIKSYYSPRGFQRVGTRLASTVSIRRLEALCRPISGRWMARGDCTPDDGTRLACPPWEATGDKESDHSRAFIHQDTWQRELRQRKATPQLRAFVCIVSLHQL